MATGGLPSYEDDDDDDCDTGEPDMLSWPAGAGSLEDRLNNWDWYARSKQANRALEKNKRSSSGSSKEKSRDRESEREQDCTVNGSSDGERRRTRIPHTYPRTKFTPHTALSERVEMENLKQRINFSDVDERSIGSDSQGRATAANNQRQPTESRKPFRFLQQQVSATSVGGGSRGGREACTTSSEPSLLGPFEPLHPTAASRSVSAGCVSRGAASGARRVPLSEIGQQEERAVVMPESSQLVSSLIQIRDNIQKATSVRDDLLEKNERSAKVERLTRLIAHLKEQEKSYMRFLRRMLNDGDEGSSGDLVAESFSLGGSASLNVDVQSLASERSERSESTGTSQSTRRRPRIEDKLGATVSDEQMSDTTVTPLKPARAQGPSGKSWSREQTVSGQSRSTQHVTSGEQELKEELESLQKQRDLLTKMLQQQEQLKQLEGRQATLLALQHTAEQELTGMDDSFVTEVTGSLSGTSLTAELHDELSELMQKFNNRQPGTKQSSQTCANNRRTVAPSVADSLSLAQEVSQARRDTAESQQLSAERAELTDKLQELQEKKQQMDLLMEKLRTLQDQELNNRSLGGARNTVSHRDGNRSSHPALPRQISAPVGGTVRQPAFTRLTSCSSFGATHHANKAPAASFSASAASFNPLTSTASDNEGSNDENFVQSVKMHHRRQLQKVRKRLNQLREQVSYYQQASDSLTESINELRDEEEEEEDTEKVFLLDSENEPEITHNLRMLGQGGTQQTVTNNMSRPQPSQRANNQARRVPLCMQGNNIHPSVSTVSTQACAYDEDKDRDEVADTESPEKVDGIEEKYFLDGDSVQSQNGSIDENEDDRFNGADEHRHHESQLSSLAESQETETLDRVSNFDATQERLETLRTLISTFQESPEAMGLLSEEMESLSVADAAHKETPNNTRANPSSQTRNPSLSPSEAYFKFRLEQQQLELRQLQKDRQRLLDIQEQLEDLGKKCPDLQSSCQDSVGSVANPLSSTVPEASSTPAVCVESGARPRDKKNSLSSSMSPVDTQLWSEIRRHQILREELRHRRKQLESMMTMQQSDHQQEKDEEASSEPMASECSDTQASYRLSRTERTMATWGGSTQYTIDDDDEDADEDDDDDDDDNDDAAVEELQNSKFCKVDVDEEDEEMAPDEKPLDVFATDSGLNPLHELSQHSECQQRWERSLRDTTLDGISPSSQTRRQENMSHQRQENSQWVSELSFSEERQQWQGQMDMLRSQLEFSTSMCQSLLQDQKVLSCLLESALTGQYNTLGYNMGNPQVNVIMQQLMTCYSQLAIQQSNVQRLHTMLNKMMQQQPGLRAPQQRAASGVPSAASPCRDVPLGTFSDPQSTGYHHHSFHNYQPAVPRFNMQPAYPMAMNVPVAGAFGSGRHNMPNQGNEPDLSLQSEYLPFPQPFESTEMSKKDTREHGKDSRNANTSTDGLDTTGDVNGGAPVSYTLDKQKKITKQNMERGGKTLDEMSMGSMSSLLDPRDPSTITKKFHFQKSKAQANLASRDKTPIGKGRKRKIPIVKGKSADASVALSTTIASHGNSHRLQTEQVDDATVQGGSLAASVRKPQQDDVSSEPGSEFSMFEALRDTIYSEVATLISQNENRPHFLLELFHELQMLNSDYLRQRALYLLQDTVTRNLTESGEKERSGPVWRASNSELTPSDSLATSDDDEGQVVGAQAKRHSYSGMTTLKPEGAEVNQNTSTNSSGPDPFANDELGNTVIHIERALAKMKELKHLKEKSEVDRMNSLEQGAVVKSKGHTDNDSARDESDSESEVPCPRVDTQQVDRQIKTIMTEVIPYLKEHMDDICSPQLLTYIRRMVLTLTQQKDESKEFVRFFHKQLGSVLQESLNKFHGRRLQDCGEDLLVEISEILFNELSFFRLMEDLDSSSRGGAPSANRLHQRRRANSPARWEVSREAYKQEPESSGKHKESSVGSSWEGPATKDEQKSKDVAGAVMTIDATEEEDLGKSRDDDLAMECQLSYKDDENEGENEDAPPRNTFYTLSQAEVLPLNNYGSGEDEEVEEEHDFDTARLDVPTSLQASAGIADDKPAQIAPATTEGIEAKAPDIPSPKAQCGAHIIIVDPVDSTLPPTNELPHIDNQPDDTTADREDSGHQDAPGVDANRQEGGSQQSSEQSSQDTESPIMVNIPQQGSASSSGSLSQKSDEDDFVQIEDIPIKLTILCEEELRKRKEQEEKQNNIADSLLADDGLGELAGDMQAVKEPGSNSPRSG